MINRVLTMLHEQPAYPWTLGELARLLADRSMKVAAVGHEVGYESEAAFSRTFKKLVGMSPAGWRDTAVGIANKELDARGRG
jgi:AraC-like DNA-binding protein